MIANENTQTPPRSAWMRCLLAADHQQVMAVAGELRQRYAIQHQVLPAAGLAMATVREPNQGAAFFLGEFPLSRAVMEITESNGQRHVGAAAIMHDDEALAQACALCDGVLAAALPGCEAVTKVIHSGAARCAAEDSIRAGLLHRTTVAFDLLQTEVNDDDDE